MPNKMNVAWPSSSGRDLLRCMPLHAKKSPKCSTSPESIAAMTGVPDMKKVRNVFFVHLKLRMLIYNRHARESWHVEFPIFDSTGTGGWGTTNIASARSTPSDAAYACLQRAGQLTRAQNTGDKAGRRTSSRCRQSGAIKWCSSAVLPSLLHLSARWMHGRCRQRPSRPCSTQLMSR